MSLELISQTGNNNKLGYNQLQNVTFGDVKAQTAEITTLTVGTGIYNNLIVNGTLTAGTGLFVSSIGSTGAGLDFTVSSNPTHTMSLSSTLLYPLSDGDVGLGAAGSSWKEVYSQHLSIVGTGLISGADANGTALTLSGGVLNQRPTYIKSYATGLISIGGATLTAVTLNSDIVNNNWSSSRSDKTKWIGPLAGYYDCRYSCSVAPSQTVVASDQYGAAIALNGSVGGTSGVPDAAHFFNAGATSSGSNGLIWSGAARVKMNGSTDYVQLLVNNGNAGSVNFGSLSTSTPNGNSVVLEIKYEGNW